MARTMDARVTDAILAAAVELAGEVGFANVSIEAVAERAGVGKPAIYRRFATKAELVAEAVRVKLRPIAAPVGDVRSALRRLVEGAAPEDPAAYGALVGGLMAEHARHPELLAAFRERVLGPRRAVVREVVERGQAEGVLRSDVDPEHAVDLLGGAFIARTFAGLDVGPAWREAFFELWWSVLAKPPAGR